MEKPAYVKKYKGANLAEYIDAVCKWSDKSGKKTTDRGWVAYIRDFMDRDLKNNSLILKTDINKPKALESFEALEKNVHTNF
jgi:hypothetical protein